jgi:hypothetical protein
MKDFFTYYEILEVGETADPEEIKKAYRSKALEYHPDRVPPRLKKESEEMFKQIGKAYEVLSDPEKRKKYDEELKNLRAGQGFDQTDYSGNPVLQVDKTRFEFKNLKWGTVISDSLAVSNTGNGILTGTIKALMGWVSLSENIIDTQDVQEIEITIDTTILLAKQDYWEAIEIRTNGGNETIHVEISTAPVTNLEVIGSLARSLVSRRWFMPLFYIIGFIFVVSFFMRDRIPDYFGDYKGRVQTISSKTHQEVKERLPQPPQEDVKVYQTLFSKRGPVGYAPVVRERRNAVGNVLERGVEYLRKEEMENIPANEEQEIFYPKTGAFYPIKKSRYPEFYKKCDLDGDGAITLYELGETQYEFNRITAKYPEGDVDSIVKEFVG